MKSESELRDYFAGQALSGELANGSWENTPNCAPRLAQWCYELADVMMHARGAEDRNRRIDRNIAKDNEAVAIAELHLKLAQFEAKEKK